MSDEPQRWTINLTSVKDTARLATLVAQSVPPGTTIGLVGTLGAGKTNFAQAFTAACGIPANTVVSPTFVICQQYQGDRFQINHLDVYRLSGGDEFIDLGADEMMESDSVQLIEWADKVTDYLPDKRLELHFEVTGEETRDITIIALGDRLAIVAAKIVDQLNND